MDDSENDEGQPGVRLEFDAQVQGRATIYAWGEFDASLAGEFRALVTRLDEATMVIVDLSDVSFMDSSGLGALMAMMRIVTGREGRVQLICGEGAVRRLLHVTGVDRLTSVVDRLELLDE